MDSINKKFALTDSGIKEMKKLSDEVSFFGNSVKDFNEEELRIAIGCLAKTIQWEQKRLLNIVKFSQCTLETINYNPTLKELR